MYAMRKWSVRHARGLESLYRYFAWVSLRLHPLWRRIGYDRMERPVALVEKYIKGLMFDCRMCGRCVLSSTGMSCPMNCPKQLRNGPCGGVRADGNCEVKPDMPCVWVEAHAGSRRMRGGDAIMDLLDPVDHTLEGTSTWLRETRRLAAEADAAKAEAAAKDSDGAAPTAS